MSIVFHRLPPTSAQSIIAQSLAMALVYIRLTEGGAESHLALIEKLRALRQMAEDLLMVSRGKAGHAD